jgi:putative ABC transport system ATP-binding protein
VLKLLETLNVELGKTILMVTHDPAAAERATVTHHLDKGAFDKTPHPSVRGA